MTPPRTAGLIVATLLLAPVRADACEVPGVMPYEIDTSQASTDTAPPAAVTKLSYEVRRGTGPETSGCSQSATSCDDVGQVRIHLTAPGDDTTPSDDLGYVIELVEGTPLEELGLRAGEAVQSGLPASDSDQRSVLTYAWIDGDTDEQEPFRFSITVAAVDRAGNVGAASEPLVIEDPGSDAVGCAVGRARGPGDTSAGLLAGLAGMALLRRRRATAQK